MRAAVRLEGHDFVGRRALAALALAPLKRMLVGFEMTEPGVPRHGYVIAGRLAGKSRRADRHVTTGLFSPSTGKYLGMGYVEAEHSAVGQRREHRHQGQSQGRADRRAALLHIAALEVRHGLQG